MGSSSCIDNEYLLVRPSVFTMVKHPRNCVLRKVLISYTRHGLAKIIIWASVRDASWQPYHRHL